MCPCAPPCAPLPWLCIDIPWLHGCLGDKKRVPAVKQAPHFGFTNKSLEHFFANRISTGYAPDYHGRTVCTVTARVDLSTAALELTVYPEIGSDYLEALPHTMGAVRVTGSL